MHWCRYVGLAPVGATRRHAASVWSLVKTGIIAPADCELRLNPATALVRMRTARLYAGEHALEHRHVLFGSHQPSLAPSQVGMTECRSAFFPGAGRRGPSRYVQHGMVWATREPVRAEQDPPEPPLRSGAMATNTTLTSTPSVGRLRLFLGRWLDGFHVEPSTTERGERRMEDTWFRGTVVHWTAVRTTPLPPVPVELSPGRRRLLSSVEWNHDHGLLDVGKFLHLSVLSAWLGPPSTNSDPGRPKVYCSSTS